MARVRLPDPNLTAADAGPQPVAGLDEVGRGPLAGPVLACALILPRPDLPGGGLPPELLPWVRDSKTVPLARRAPVAEALAELCHVGIGVAEVDEIDALNIHHATLLAMARAVQALPHPPGCVRVDGRFVPTGLPCPARAHVGGDARFLEIAAASIVAKVERDRRMAQLAAQHPGYGWERNAGYPTEDHRAALRRLGPTRHHRAGWALVQEALVADLTVAA